MSISLIYYEPLRYKEQFQMTAGSCPRYMLILLLEGAFVCRTQGREYRVEAGQVACFPPNVPFERRVVEPIRYIQIGFYASEGDPYAMTLPAGLLEVSREQILAVGQGYGHGQVFYEHLISFLIIQHTLNCGGSALQNRVADGETERAVAYFFDHLNEKINMEALAAQLHLSYTGFLWKFRRAMGCTPMEYLQNIRMQRAKQLLLEEKLRINEIAAFCGYQNAYYFTNAFHKAYGISPREFRKKNTEQRVVL